MHILQHTHFNTICSGNGFCMCANRQKQIHFKYIFTAEQQTKLSSKNHAELLNWLISAKDFVTLLFPSSIINLISVSATRTKSFQVNFVGENFSLDLVSFTKVPSTGSGIPTYYHCLHRLRQLCLVVNTAGKNQTEPSIHKYFQTN